MSKSILFVVNNFNIGGPQKSLLSLLHNFPEECKVDLMVLNKELGIQEYLPSNVTLRHVSNEFPLLILNKKDVMKNLLRNSIGNPILVLKAMKMIISSVFEKSLVQRKQKFWIENKELIKKYETKKYDYAIAVSGGHSIMYIVDFINAKSKVGWIRTEYQNLDRDLEIDREYFKKLNIILSVSQKSSNKFIEIFPEEKDKVKTFYNPLPYKMYNNLFGKDENDNEIRTINFVKISTISRLDKDKGFELVVEAARYLRDGQYNFKWDIYGVGPMKNKIHKSLKENGLQDFVHLKGFEFNTGVILKNTDILVHSSRFEGKSNTIDEAKYYGVPIVTTNFPTVGEQLVNNYNAIITSIEGKSLYKGIATMIDDSSLRKKLSDNLIKEQQDSRDVFKEFKLILESEALK